MGFEGDNPLAITPIHDFRLEARRVTGESLIPKKDLRVYEEEAFRGNEKQIRQILSALKSAVVDINRRDLDYGSIHLLSESQNSNSVYGTLMGVAEAQVARDRRQRVRCRP